MPRKGENIYKRKDGRWEGRYPKGRSEDGKMKYGYVYAKSYRDVKQKMLQVQLSPPREEKSAVAGMPFRQLAANWLQDHMPTVKESTYYKYRNILDLHLNPEFADRLLEEITYEEVSRFAIRLQTKSDGKGLSPKTVSDILSVLRSIFRYGGRLGAEPAFDVSLIRTKQAPKEIRVLTTGEQEKLQRYLYGHLDGCQMGILLCLRTGLRVGEVCALRWEDISLSEQTLFVHQTMQRLRDFSDSGTKTHVVITTPKSSCSVRTIPIPSDLCRILKDYQTTSTGFFLTNSPYRYIEPRTMQNRFQQVLKSCGVEAVNFHVLRHTFATRCVELGFDVKSLSEILGHANVRITMDRYVHPSMDIKRQNMEKMSALFAVK